MEPGRARRDQEIGAFGDLRTLEFLEKPAGILGGQPGLPPQYSRLSLGQGQFDTGRLLAILLYRLTWQKMLQELHSRTPGVRCHGNIQPVVQPALPACG